MLNSSQAGHHSAKDSLYPDTLDAIFKLSLTRKKQNKSPQVESSLILGEKDIKVRISDSASKPVGSSNSNEKTPKQVSYADLAQKGGNSKFTGFYSSSQADLDAEEKFSQDQKDFSQKSISFPDDAQEKFDFPLQLDFLHTESG